MLSLHLLCFTILIATPCPRPWLVRKGLPIVLGNLSPRRHPHTLFLRDVLHELTQRL